MFVVLVSLCNIIHHTCYITALLLSVHWFENKIKLLFFSLDAAAVKMYHCFLFDVFMQLIYD